ncbi:gp14 [Mycobacterium phage Corndog]|uniref:HTH merR-type domain-containing protein n=1 Tax=Mycobacterium phage Corndog TaxID=205875 RepID=Q856T0_BPMCO|nr:gp14 [Mycobacterium phage Corndog]AAN01946.1 hypothetical protein PBI_CORNDOG_14 [Mycobacterium phage Corndog]
MTEFSQSDPRIEKLAHRLRVNQRTVRRWLKQGIINPAVLDD